jgi:subtilisin family serine protease
MLVGVGALVTAVVVPGVPAAAVADPTALYIVQLAAPPIAGYTGTVSGLPATKPAEGIKLDTTTSNAQRYRSYLTGQHKQFAAKVSGVTQVYDYTTAFDGFAARMPASAAAALAHTSGVLNVTKNAMLQTDTVSTPAFLGLSAPGGLWSQLGGPGPQGAGRNIVIGDIDSGITPDAPSFAPLAGAGKFKGFHGTCQPADDGSWTASDCTNKIMGARWYDAGLGGDAAVLAANPEYLSARDHNGHGTHTAGTAAGDYNTPVVVNGNTLGDASGMAPNARLAIYKALWDVGGGRASGSDADILSAIDAATNDGVDVINFSVSGSLTSTADPVEVAFLFAADAGIFVSAAAGNEGPGASTVNHPSPWLTTVAAGTHDRLFQASVTLGNGATYTGAGVGAAVLSSPLIRSGSAGLPAATPSSVRLCFSKEWDPTHPEGFLDPTKVAGKIVVCDRGTNDRVDKSKAVKEAGGVGMILANTSPNTLNFDFHSVPTVHVSDTDGAAIKSYIAATKHPTAALGAGHAVTGFEAPQVASFSSRGPSLADSADILKPDIMAPGVNVLAAVAPVDNNGIGWNFDSGTSMATPHIAGIAALLKQKHPSWSPMEIKSALMTTGSTVDNKANPITTDTGAPAGPFDYGSGQVTPNSAVDPGMVYDSGFTNWIQYLCGAGELDPNGSTCTSFGSIDPSNLNQPNIAVGQLAGIKTVTRTVTNVGATRESYTAHVDAPAGVSVSVVPSTIVFSPAQQTATYTVTFTRTTAQYGQFTFGALTWQSGTHSVRSTLAVDPVGASTPAEVDSIGTSGSANLSVTSGFDGTMSTSVAGLLPATVHTSTLSAPTGGSFDKTNPTASAHTAHYTDTVAAGTTLARFQIFAADYPTGTDMDLYVFHNGALVGVSAGGTADEHVDLNNPVAGSYDVYVDLFALPAGATSLSTSEYSWTLGSAAAGDLAVTPPSQAVTTGHTATFAAGWSGLTSGTRYLGTVSFSDGTTTVGRTIVQVLA